MAKPIERCPTCGRLRSQESANPCRCKDAKDKATGLSGPHFIRWLFIIGLTIAVIYFGILLSAMLSPKF